jgi:hypothetical protein
VQGRLVEELQEAVAALTQQNLRYAAHQAAEVAPGLLGQPHEKNLLLAALMAAPPGPLSLTSLLTVVKEVEAAGPSLVAADLDFEAAWGSSNGMTGRKHLSDEQVGCTAGPVPLPACLALLFGALVEA